MFQVPIFDDIIRKPGNTLKMAIFDQLLYGNKNF